MGMWYGIEILKHGADEHYVRIGYSCPILHLSEEKDNPYPTYNPLYKDYNYGYNYGERRPPTRPTDRTTRPTYRYDEHGRPIQTSDYNNRRYGSKYYNSRDQPNEMKEMKRLRIWWDENGKATEYHIKYNTTKPGFWISSGPQNGSLLEPQYSNFAGTIQVIKAVGNHMVLTFCHQLPERQLFTVLLSRENKLGQPDIHSVHTLLARKGLSTNAVTKVCWNGNDRVKVSLGTLCLLMLSFSISTFR